MNTTLFNQILIWLVLLFVWNIIYLYRTDIQIIIIGISLIWILRFLPIVIFTFNFLNIHRNLTVLRASSSSSFLNIVLLIKLNLTLLILILHQFLPFFKCREIIITKTERRPTILQLQTFILELRSIRRFSRIVLILLRSILIVIT